MQHHATATFRDRSRVDQAIEALVNASVPHEQLRLVVRNAAGETKVRVSPWRPVLPFAAVAAPLTACVAIVSTWDQGASLPSVVFNGLFAASLGGLFAGYGALYFWQVRAAWPSAVDDEVQVLTVRGSQEQARRAAQVLETLTPELDTGDGSPRLVDGR